jgi:hypothetical protein
LHEVFLKFGDVDSWRSEFKNRHVSASGEGDLM